MHKKGADGEKRVLKKTRKANTTKGRGVFGASIEEIKKKRDQSAAARATARAKALRYAPPPAPLQRAPGCPASQSPR